MTKIDFVESSAATRTFFLGGQNFIMGGQAFLVGLLFLEFSADLQKEKRSSCQFDLLLSKFYVDLKNKKRVISGHY